MTVAMVGSHVITPSASCSATAIPEHSTTAIGRDHYAGKWSNTLGKTVRPVPTAPSPSDAKRRHRQDGALPCGFSSCGDWTRRTSTRLIDTRVRRALVTAEMSCGQSEGIAIVTDTPRASKDAGVAAETPIVGIDRNGGEGGSGPGSRSANQFIRPHLLNLAPYTPIEPFEILSARLGFDVKDIVKLDANENLYGPPPEVLKALGSMDFPNIYPDPESRRLRAELAKDCGIGMEHLLVGCGADELIDLIMRCTLDPGDKIVDCPPTFTMYVFDAAVNNVEVVQVPRLPGFGIDVEGVKEAIRRHGAKAVFLTSPNNPDGSIMNDEDLLEILQLPVLVILDEAYIEFASINTRMAWVKDFENLIVLRTFSKRAGLAGLRVGYGAFPLGLIDFLWRAKQPYNVSVAGEIAACAALSNPTYLTSVRDALINERERLFGLLAEIPFLEPHPSHANFILCSVTGGMDAKKVKEDLAAKKVMVRHYDRELLRGYIRVSVGKPEHTDALMKALRSLV